MKRIEELDETSDIQAVVAAVRNRADEIRGNLGPKNLWEERVERADELMEIADRIDTATKRETVAGNAAKLREAAQAWMDYWTWGGYDGLREHRLKAQTKAALAAPPRNCDRFATADGAREAWWQEEILPRVHGQKDGVELAYHKWLFAPAEQEGCRQ